MQDCWVRDLAFVNADNGVLVSGSDRVTVRGIDISYTKPRGQSVEVPWDGHWGVRVGERASELGAAPGGARCRAIERGVAVPRALKTRRLRKSWSVGVPSRKSENAVRKLEVGARQERGARQPRRRRPRKIEIFAKYLALRLARGQRLTPRLAAA